MRKITELTTEYILNLIPPRDQFSHKGSFGNVLNIAGSENFTGAAYLSSIAPLKVGAGYVTLASCEKVINSVSSKASEIVFYPLRGAENNITPKALKDIVKIADNYKVISIGCGLNHLGTPCDEVLSFIEEFFERFQDSDKIFVIDADALNAIAELGIEKLPANSVLTPHPKELSRLLNVPVEFILTDTIKYSEIASDKYNSTVVIKGHKTHIADCNNIFVNTTGNSALAKAGTGDVLTGMIAGFAAQGVSAIEAAVLGVFIHGLAGQYASEYLTQYGVLATDVLNYLPITIKHLLSGEV